jgi:hypothetical protein
MRDVLARLDLSASFGRRRLTLIAAYAIVLLALDFLCAALLWLTLFRILDAKSFALIRLLAPLSIAFGVFVDLAKRHPHHFIGVGTAVAIVIALWNFLLYCINPHGAFRPLFTLGIGLAANAVPLYLAGRVCGMLSNNRWRGP